MCSCAFGILHGTNVFCPGAQDPGLRIVSKLQECFGVCWSIDPKGGTSKQETLALLNGPVLVGGASMKNIVG